MTTNLSSHTQSNHLINNFQLFLAYLGLTNSRCFILLLWYFSHIIDFLSWQLTVWDILVCGCLVIFGLGGVLFFQFFSCCLSIFSIELVDLLTLFSAHISHANIGVILSWLVWLAHIAALLHLVKVLEQSIAEEHELPRDILSLHEALLSYALLLDLL